MNKKGRRKRLFGAKVLAISGAAVFMVGGVNNLYADIRSDARIKKKMYAVQTVERNVMEVAFLAKPKEFVKLESIQGYILEKQQKKIKKSCYDPRDEYMLAKIAMAEAESEGVEGKALVILVVLNRVQSDRFPDSVSEVVFQRGQFTPVSNGRYDRVEPDQECYKALNLIQMENWDESQGALYFESKSASNWHKNNLYFLFQYGNHYFYTDKELTE